MDEKNVNKYHLSNLKQKQNKRVRDGSLIRPNFGLTTCGRPQLKLYYYYWYYDLGLKSVCGAGSRILQPNLTLMPNTNKLCCYYKSRYGVQLGLLCLFASGVKVMNI